MRLGRTSKEGVNLTCTPNANTPFMAEDRGGNGVVGIKPDHMAKFRNTIKEGEV